MNKLLGYGLMGVGLLGFFFLLKYKGTAIPVKELLFVLSIFILSAGAYLLAKHKLQKLNSQHYNSNSNRYDEIEQLKRNGDKIRISLDNTEVKSRSYRQEIVNEALPSSIEMLDALYDNNRNYKTQDVQQTYLVLFKQYNGKTYKFVSQSTSRDTDAVKRYIDQQKGIDLYIDPKNPANYYFDLPYV